jgi:hypothetical protein
MNTRWSSVVLFPFDVRPLLLFRCAVKCSRLMEYLVIKTFQEFVQYFPPQPQPLCSPLTSQYVFISFVWELAGTHGGRGLQCVTKYHSFVTWRTLYPTTTLHTDLVSMCPFTYVCVCECIVCVCVYVCVDGCVRVCVCVCT